MRAQQFRTRAETIRLKTYYRFLILSAVLTVASLGIAGGLGDLPRALDLAQTVSAQPIPPRLSVTPDFIIPQQTATEHVVKVVLGGNVGFPVTNGNVAIGLPSYMTYVSGAATGTSIVGGGGQNATASGGQNQEVAKILSMEPLTLAGPLKLDHKVGEMVVWIEAPAATATVTGRVITANRRGIGDGIVTISDTDGMSRIAPVNTFGYFRFVDVMPGRQYNLTVRSRRYQFAPRQISVSGDVADIEIVPLN